MNRKQIEEIEALGSVVMWARLQEPRLEASDLTTELARLAKKAPGEGEMTVSVARLRRLISAVEEAIEYFAARADADCEEGHWRMNEEMRHEMDLEEALKGLKRDSPESWQSPPSTPERSTICRFPGAKEE